MFRIRSKKTGLYSTGGYNPDFNKNGKLWRTMGMLVAHLNQVSPMGRVMYSREEVEIETYKLVKTGTLPVEDLITTGKKPKIGDPVKSLIKEMCT